MQIPLSWSHAQTLIASWHGNLWSKQEEIGRAVFAAGKRVTCVTSCTGSGKSYGAANILAAYILGGENRRVITTAPTGRQVDDNLWTELRMLHRRAREAGVPMGGVIADKAARWHLGDGWDAVGFTSDDEAGYAGRHSRGGTLVILDDAQGITRKVWDTLLATLTGANDRMLALANPTKNGGPFYDHVRLPGLAAATNRIHISAFDCPNVIAGREVIPGAVTVEQVETLRAYGVESHIYKTRVLGVHADEDARALVRLDWIDKSNRDWAEVAPYLARNNATPELITVGADVAGEGDEGDEGISAVVGDYQMRDLKLQIPINVRVAQPLIVHPRQDTQLAADYLLTQTTTTKAHNVRVDASGLGKGIFDRCRVIGVPVVAMIGGSSANNAKQFYNARAEWAWALREALRPKDEKHRDDHVRLLMPPDEILLHQLTTTLVDESKDGRFKLEPKDDWKARNQGRSPDRADALMMAVGPAPRGAASSGLWQAAYGMPAHVGVGVRR